MKTKTTWSAVLTLAVTLSTFASDPTAPRAVVSASPAAVAEAPAQFALALGKRAAAPAETGSESLFAASDAVAKARTQVEKELAGLSGGSSSAGRSLVVPKQESDAKSVSDTEEDLAVMSRILEKSASSRDDKSTHAMGISVYGFPSSSFPRSLYLEGYGAVFFLNVSIPLMPPASKKEEKEPKEETSTEWENARRELFQPSSFSTEKWYAFDQMNGAFSFSGGGPAEEYDADKVDDLKKNLVNSLKNAVHIRKLGADEMVTIVVTGRARDGRSALRRSATTSTTSNGRLPNVWIASTGNAPDAKSTRLIVRAKRTDIEAFQKDKMTADEFRKHVTIMTY